MKKMYVRHDLPASVDVAWREIFSAAYAKAVQEETGTTTTRLSEESRGPGERLVRSQVTLARELPPAAAKVLGTTRLQYTLEERIDDGSYTVQWRVIVEKVSDTVKASGTFTLKPTGPDTCERVIDGQVSVAVPFIGGRIEQGILDELSKSYEATAVFARAWLRDAVKLS